MHGNCMNTRIFGYKNKGFSRKGNISDDLELG